MSTSADEGVRRDRSPRPAHIRSFPGLADPRRLQPAGLPRGRRGRDRRRRLSARGPCRAWRAVLRRDARGRRRDPGASPRGAGRAGARPDGRARHRRLHARVRPGGRRPGLDGDHVADRGAEGPRRADRRPLRQARQQRPAVERAGEAGRHRPRDVRRLLRQRRRQPRLGRLARPELPDRLRPQRGQPRRHRADRAPRLPPRLHGPRPRRAVPGARAPPVAGADAAGRRRARRHAGRDRTDDVPAALAEVRARLHGDRPARVPGVLRGALRAAAAGEGRCGVLQPRPAARRGHEPDHGRQADGEPAAGLVGVRPGAGHGRHRSGSRRRSTRRCAPARRPALRARTCTTSSPQPPRATPSRRTWTATRRSAR